MEKLPFTKDFNKLYAAYCISFGLGIVLPILTVIFMILTFIALGAKPNPQMSEAALAISAVIMFGLVAWIPLIISIVFFCIMLYRFWELVPIQNRKHGLGALIGFLFIPWFNLYWNFVAIWGVGKEYNRMFGEKKKEAFDVLSLVICICLIVAPAISYILLIFWLYQMKNAAIILQQKALDHNEHENIPCGCE